MIFSIAMGADYSFGVKNIEIWVPTFFKHNKSSVATVAPRPPGPRAPGPPASLLLRPGEAIDISTTAHCYMLVVCGVPTLKPESPPNTLFDKINGFYSLKEIT